MKKDSIIYVAGHEGMVGRAVTKLLKKEGYHFLITPPRRELDLTNQVQVNEFFSQNKIEYVFLCAARVGGILENNYHPTSFLYDNLMIGANVVHAAARSGVKKLLNLGSSCMYPKYCDQPMKESSLLTGELEPTNEAYALAKIAILKLCQAYMREWGKQFITAIPCNLYGPNDNFDLFSSHVVPGLMAKIDQASTRHETHVKVWGSGHPKREFLYVEDLAEALLFLMENYQGIEPINVGSGKELTIQEVAISIGQLVGFKGLYVYDPTKPDGAPRKVLDNTPIQTLGWKSKTSFQEGLKYTYEWYLNNIAEWV